MEKNKLLIIEAIALAIGVTCGLIIWVNFTLHKRKTNTDSVSAYQSIKGINLSGVPDREIFSEDVDCVWVDRLGITNVSFKQTYSNQ
jgi:hypothetical protein